MTPELLLRAYISDPYYEYFLYNYHMGYHGIQTESDFFKCKEEPCYTWMERKKVAHRLLDEQK